MLGSQQMSVGGMQKQIRQLPPGHVNQQPGPCFRRCARRHSAAARQELGTPAMQVIQQCRLCPSKARKQLRVVAATASKPAVQVAVEKLSTTNRSVIITVTAATCNKAFNLVTDQLRKSYAKASKGAALPGFRDGSVPLEMLVKEMGGPRRFKLAVLEEVLMTTMPTAMKLTGEAIVDDSERIATPMAELEKAFDPTKPLQYVAEYETLPPIAWARPYKEAEVTLRDTGDFKTDAAATDDLIRQYLKMHGSQRVVTGRGLTSGDVCIVDMQVTPEGARTPLPGLDQKRLHFDTERDDLGLVQSMGGMTAGEERTIPLVFPDDYPVELWQGLRATAVVRLHELFKWVLPEFDDEFVAAHYPQFESAETMKKSLLATTAMQRVQQLDKALEDAVMAEVVACAAVPELPESMLIEMGSRQYRAALLQMVKDRVSTAQDAEKLATAELVEEYIEKRKDELRTLVTWNLLVDPIFQAEGLKVEEADVQAEIDTRAAQLQAEGVEYDPELLRAEVTATFTSIKVIEWLKDNLKRNIIPFDGSAPVSATPPQQQLAAV